MTYVANKVIEVGKEGVIIIIIILVFSFPKVMITTLLIVIETAIHKPSHYHIPLPALLCFSIIFLFPIAIFLFHSYHVCFKFTANKTTIYPT